MPKCPGRASTCFCISDLTRMFKMFKVVRKSFVKTLRDPMGRIFGTAIGANMPIGRVGRATSATNVAKWHASSFGLKSAGDSKSLSGSFPEIRSILWKIWWRKIIEAMTCTRWVAITWYDQGSEQDALRNLSMDWKPHLRPTNHISLSESVDSTCKQKKSKVQSVQTCPNMSKHIFQDLPRSSTVSSWKLCSLHFPLDADASRHWSDTLWVWSIKDCNAPSGGKVWHDAIVKDAAHSLTKLVSRSSTSWTWNDEMMKWWNDEMMKWWNDEMMKWSLSAFIIGIDQYRSFKVIRFDVTWPHPKAPQTRTRLGSPLHAVPAKQMTECRAETLRNLWKLIGCRDCGRDSSNGYL